MSWINPEPIAPAAPILVFCEREVHVEDGYQQQQVEDRINIGTPLPQKRDHGQVQDEAATQQPVVSLQQDFPDQQNHCQAAVVTLAELEEDPRYQCVKSQIEPSESQDQCSGSCAKCYTPVIQLNSCHTWTRNVSQYQCGMFEDLIPNDKLQRAYVTGWAMLMSSVFPFLLVPNHKVKGLWVLCQLVFAILLFGLSVAAQMQSQAALVALLVVTTMGLLLAIVDAVSCFATALIEYITQQQNEQLHEAEPLLHHNHNSRSSLKDKWFRYSDLMRLVVSEMIVWVLILVVSWQPYTGPEVSIICGLMYSAVAVLIIVYSTQLLFGLRFTVNLWRQLEQLPTTRYKATWLLFRFWLHFISYRVFEILYLVLLALDIDYVDPDWQFPTIGILTYVTPVVGILTFFILKHGWIHDLCITYCTDYLSYLNLVQCNPNTAQETKQSIQAALMKFEFQTLTQESHKYRNCNTRVTNFLYPISNPLIFLFTLPNAICLAALFTCIILSPALTFLLGMVVALFFVVFINNFHLLLVVIAWPVVVVGGSVYVMKHIFVLLTPCKNYGL